MNETLIIVAGTIFASGLIAELFAVVSAPVGYQDERGFHVGEQVSESVADGQWENPS
ncbi:MAG: hypothetical protein HY298_15690 [Verrucomicrobia bacterium]|nr:hypothetical protein [Verrucomicrobiota bacterium]